MSEWIEWKGGECPVSWDEQVTIRTAGGSVIGPASAGVFIWTENCISADIIAYQVAKPAAETKLFDATKLRGGDRVLAEVIVEQAADRVGNVMLYTRFIPAEAIISYAPETEAAPAPAEPTKAQPTPGDIFMLWEVIDGLMAQIDALTGVSDVIRAKSPEQPNSAPKAPEVVGGGE